LKSKLLIFFVLFLFTAIVFNRASAWKEAYALQWDKAGYYVYLPAIFIHKDLSHLSFYQPLLEKYKLVAGTFDPCYGCHVQPETKKVLNKYPLGVALAELPFFLIAHLYTSLSQPGLADGFSSGYQLSVLLATIFWSFVGLWHLRKLLLRYFANDAVVFLTLSGIALGTNFYYYSAFDGGMSHAFSFAFFAIALRYTDHFFTSSRLSHACIAALFAGMIVIARPTNILFCLLLIFWQVNDFASLKARLQLWASNYLKVLAAIGIFLLVVSLQIGYWKFVTGHWIYYSYEGEGFNFTNPSIVDGLLSYRKGWFVYTPLAFLSLWGFRALGKIYPRLPLLLVFYLAVNIYVIFSWSQWSYGGGFGSRPFIEAYVVIAFPLAALLQWALHSGKLFRTLFITFFFSCIALNIWQSYQFSRGIIPPDNNTRAYYWKVFLKAENDEGDRALLNTE